MPSRTSKEARLGSSQPRPRKRKRPKASEGGRTPHEVAFAKSVQAAGHSVSPTNLHVAAPTRTDPALRMNAVTGLTTTPSQRREVAGKLSTTRSANPYLTWGDLAEMTGLPGAGRAAYDMAGTIVPVPGVKQAKMPSGGDAVDLTTTLLALAGVGAAAKLGKVGKGVRDAEKAAEDAGRASKAATRAREIPTGSSSPSRTAVRQQVRRTNRAVAENQKRIRKLNQAREQVQWAKLTRAEKLRRFGLELAHRRAITTGQVPSPGLPRGASTMARLDRNPRLTVRAAKAAALSPAYAPVVGPKLYELAEKNLAIRLATIQALASGNLDRYERKLLEDPRFRRLKHSIQQEHQASR